MLNKFAVFIAVMSSISLLFLLFLFALNDIKRTERASWCKHYHDSIQFEECMTEGAKYVQK